MKIFWKKKFHQKTFSSTETFVKATVSFQKKICRNNYFRKNIQRNQKRFLKILPMDIFLKDYFLAIHRLFQIFENLPYQITRNVDPEGKRNEKGKVSENSL